jgi:Flp pilus assembly protein TadG
MLFAKWRKDRGDSTLVSTIIVIPLIVAILITIVDTSMFFSNRAYIVNATRDAARTIAIFGGDGTPTTETPLEHAYGSVSDPCAGLKSNPMIAVKADPYTANTDVECQLMANLASSAGLVNTKITGVECGPNVSTFIGQQAYCDVTWSYAGVPASGLTLLRAGGNTKFASSEDNALESGKGLDGEQKTRVTTTTEVKLETGDLVKR